MSFFFFCAQECGIPKHFGLFYAMGTALMMEGLLSACYHVCPNYTNFQFGLSSLIHLLYVDLFCLPTKTFQVILLPNSYNFSSFL